MNDRAPFWSDDFDMDLLTILPATVELLGPTADVALVTTGHLTHGRLNHPTVWNGGPGFVAFFGFQDPARHTSYWTDDPIVRCTYLEAIRDAWVHTYQVRVEGQVMWGGTPELRQLFDHLMAYHRSWRECDPVQVVQWQQALAQSLHLATARMDDLQQLARR